ncbi:MAG: WD40 repeat domain-containing protein [Thermofilaceae archaeon]
MMVKKKSGMVLLAFLFSFLHVSASTILPVTFAEGWHTFEPPLHFSKRESVAASSSSYFLIPMMTVNVVARHAVFLRDDYLFLFDGYGDAVTHPNGTTYIAVGEECAHVHVLDVQSFSYVGNITTYYKGVYKVSSFFPLNTTLVWNRSGVFSGDGSFLLEDVKLYGSTARVFDLRSGETIPIEWGINASFFSFGINFDGSVIVAGSPSSGLLLVYERVYDKEQEAVVYRKVFEMRHNITGTEDRLFLSKDANLIVYMVYNSSFLFFFRHTTEYVNTSLVLGNVSIKTEGFYRLFGIYESKNETFTAFSVLYEEGQGFVALGTGQGSAYFLSFDSSQNRVEVKKKFVFSAAETAFPIAVSPSFYWKAPLYIRGVVSLVFAVPQLWTTGLTTLLYYIPLNTTYLYNHTTTSSTAIAFSPSGRYLFSCDTLFFIVEGDPQSGKPRLRLWGTITYEGTHDVKTPLVFNTPSGVDWHAYFFDGRIRITELVTQKETVRLVLDKDYLEGNLANIICRRGLETYSGEFAACGAHLYYSAGDAFLESASPILPLSKEQAQELLKRMGVAEETIPPDIGPERTIIYTSLHTHRSFYGWGGSSMVSDGILIPIRFTAAVSSFETVTPVVKVQVAGAAALKDPLSGTVLGVSFGAFATGVTSALALKAGYGTLQTLTFAAMSALAHTGAIYWETAMAAGTVIMKAAAAFPILSIAVGTALAVETYMMKQYEEAALASYRYFIALAPVIEDKGTGRRYVVVAYILPREEILARGPLYETMGKELFKCLTMNRAENVLIRLVTYGETWSEYRRYMQEGRIPQVELVALVREMISIPFGIPMERLVITGAALAIQQMTEGKSTLIQYLAGGLKIYTALIVHGVAIQVGGTLAANVVSDPRMIATMLKYVYVNGKPFNFTTRDDGVYIDFTIPDGSTALVISFPEGARGYARMEINMSVVLKKDFIKLGDFGYEVRMHYDWKNTVIRLVKIEFVDMEYPLRYAERELIYAAGNRMVNDISRYFFREAVVEDPSSPSGYRYYYASTNVVLLDPTNGGLLQPCKTYIYRYFYTDPPDVGIEVYFNGTQVTTSLARHATIVLRSNIDQRAAFTVALLVGAYRGLQTVIFRNVTLARYMSVTIRNGVAYEVFDIQEYVNEAVRLAREYNTSAFVQVDAWIVSAEYNYITTNDYASARYYPPAQLREVRPVNLTIEVLDAFRRTPVQGALVEVLHNDTGKKVAGTTNASGMVTFSTYSGLHYINVTASGYQSVSEKLFVDTDMKKTIYLVLSNFSRPPSPPINKTEEPYIVNETAYWWLSVQVVYRDGYPFAGASVLVKNKETGEIIASGETDGTGYLHVLVKNNTIVSITVSAVNPRNKTQVFVEERDVCVLQHLWVVFRLPWLSEAFEPEVAITRVEIPIHYGLGYYYGNVTHTVLVELWTNMEQNVTLLVEIIDSEGNVLLSRLLNLSLKPGLTTNMTFFSVNASEGMQIRARAKIVAYRYDTDLSNNELSSEWVYLKPFINIAVEVFWVPVRLRSAFSVIPEDEILIAIRVTVTTNVTTTPLVLIYSHWMFDLERGAMRLAERRVLAEKFPKRGTYWINLTTVVPWSNMSLINIFALHELDTNIFDNNASALVYIWPNVKLMEFKARTPLAREGREVTFYVKIRSNVPEEERMNVVITISSITVNEVIARGATYAKPWVELTLKGKAPLNPRIGFFGTPLLPSPIVTHDVECYATGYDVYEADNSMRTTLLVTADYMFWLIIIAIIVFLLIFAKVFLLAVNDAYTGRFVVRRTRRKKIYVQRMSDHGREKKKEEEGRFVKRKGDKE